MSSKPPNAFRKLAVALLAVGVFVAASRSSAEVLDRKAKDTLTAVELDTGDSVCFRLRNGRVCTLLLEDADAAIVEQVTPGGIVYRFGCQVQLDGQPRAKVTDRIPLNASMARQTVSTMCFVHSTCRSEIGSTCWSTAMCISSG